MSGIILCAYLHLHIIFQGLSPYVFGTLSNVLLFLFSVFEIWLIGKDTDAGRDWGQEEKGTTEDEMARWHHWFNGRESEWTPGVGDRQGGLACCDSWGCKELDTTEQLNWTELSIYILVIYLMWFASIFFTSMACHFIFLNHLQGESFNFDEIQYIFFFSFIAPF